MIPIYEKKEEKLCAVHKRSEHFPPHLHTAAEMVYVTKGTLELGIARELYHMEQGDFAVIFPDLIHHFQVFGPEKSAACHIIVPSGFTGQFQETMQKMCPENPVIPKDAVNEEMKNAIRSLQKMKQNQEQKDITIAKCYVQILLAHCMSYYQLIEKSRLGSDDLVFQMVTYIAGHYKEEVTLEQMAKALGVSKYVLSRTFSSVFHRVFKEICRMTPKEYRKANREKYYSL